MSMFKAISNLKSTFVLVLATLLLVSSFGLSLVVDMTMDASAHMTHCPFMPGVSFCTMTPMEMIAISQSFLHTIALGEDGALLLLLISTVVILRIVPHFFLPPKLLSRFPLLQRRLRPFYHFLCAAFSSGILNPKLY